jgi:hypothetical protein
VRLFICPCCEKPTLARETPMTQQDMRLGFARMAERGWTASRLLAERLTDIDGIAPGMSDYLRGVVAAATVISMAKEGGAA